ncbi:MAG: 50S ribosomal protein L1 [Candidatus Altiarchaeota archaeon]|nr:50S ribosomal protein L1 [Candidatus Altiarchaeota archaeon]
MNKKEISKLIEEAKEKSTKRKFKQSVEICMNFRDMNIESSEYKLNLSVLLPKGRGKDIKIGVFADGDMNVRAKKLSKYVLSRAELEEYSRNKRKMRKFATECYTFIAQPELMALIGKTWGIVLGPRGKMPQPVPDNADLEAVMTRLKNIVRIRSKKNPTIQAPVGVEDMDADDLAENVLAVIDAVERQIPKEKIHSVYLKATMGPVIKLM